MAKLNITFVDELGNNLNRYKAIDVNTNEEFIFDLSRDGTITTPGTPLNAERLNAIVNAINSMDTEKQEQIDTLKNETKELREDFDNSFTEKSVTRKIRKLVDYPSKEISYPDQNVTLKQLGGMSYKYNQLSQITNYTNNVTDTKTYFEMYIQKNISPYNNVYNTTINSNGIKSIFFTVNQSTTYRIKHSGATYDVIILDNIPLNINHKYLLKFNLLGYDPSVLNGLSLDDIMLVDLTAIYGAGNEPTTATQFLNDYPMYNDYVEYTEGDIINAAVSSVDSVGTNIWDEEWVRGYWDEGNNGIFTPYTYGDYIACKNHIRVQPNTTYKITRDAALPFVLFYDFNKNYLSYGRSNTFTTPNNCYFITFYYHDYGTTYNNDMAVIQGDTGTYSPYVHNNYPIPSSIQALEGYGWGINESCYNYIDFENKKFVKKVGRVDLGTLDWSYNVALHIMASANINVKTVSAFTKANILASKYITDTYDNVYNNVTDKTIALDEKMVRVYDTSYTDAATFKAAMSGVYLYYELATPVEIDIVALNNYPVWQYGTETQNSILPAIMIKEYSISTLDQIVKNIEVDANQTDMIEKLVEKDSAIDNSIKNITTQQTNHSSAISDLSDRVVDLELYKIDKSKLTLQQNLIKTKLLYDGVVISEVNSADVMVTPKIYISVEQVDQYNYNEILKVENNTSYDMYVSMNGKGTHSKFNVPSGLTKTSSKTISIGAEGIPNNYTANIELEVYFNSNRTDNIVGFTLIKNKKIINLVADVTTTDK